VYAHLGKYIAEQGYCAAVIDYRLSAGGKVEVPPHLDIKHPEHTLDCTGALVWLIDNASSFKYSTHKIYLVRSISTLLFCRLHCWLMKMGR
jgi:acetyl esterase/lipase